MKMYRNLIALVCLMLFVMLACKKEQSNEDLTPTPTPVDTVVTTPVDTTIVPPTDTTIVVPPTDSTQTPPVTDTTHTNPPADTTVTTPVTPPSTGDTTTTTPPTTPPVTDTTTAPPPPPAPVLITIKNAGFEDSLAYWKTETAYRGRNGFKASADAVRTGNLGLNFYASQPDHFQYAKQETPWNGKIYQTRKGLKDGIYIFKVYADAVGNGMYLWADGGAGEANVLIKSDINEINTLEFEVKGGIAKFGFICIDAGGSQHYAPYFHADDVELLRK